MSTHNIGFYEEFDKNYLSIIIKYHQIHTCHVFTFALSTQCGEIISKCPRDLIYLGKH